MTAVICDDIREERKALFSCLRRFEAEEGVETDITEYESAAELLAAHDTVMRSDVLFLDIYMGEKSGMDAARELREAGFPGSIVFCTSSEDHALLSYKVNADGYILKPYEYNDVLHALKRCRRCGKRAEKASPSEANVLNTRCLSKPLCTSKPFPTAH